MMHRYHRGGFDFSTAVVWGLGMAVGFAIARLVGVLLVAVCAFAWGLFDEFLNTLPITWQDEIIEIIGTLE